MKAAGLALVTPDGRALFLKRNGDKQYNGGTWCFPGGKVEDGEEPIDAALRETREETGFIKPDDLDEEPQLICETTFYKVNFTTYRLDIRNEFMPDLGDGEHVAYAWAPLGSPPEPLHPGMQDILPVFAQDMQAPLTTAVNSGVPVAPKEAEDCALAMDEASVQLRRRATSVFALDQQSVRSYDMDGRLHVAMTPISKACVNPYLGREIPGFEEQGLQPDKVYYLLRDPEELEKAAATFNRVQLLDDHIPVSAEEPQKDITVGATGSDAVFNYPYLCNSLVVWDQHAIDEIESKKKKELSSAYRYTVDWTPGNFNGENYDGVMRDIVANHVCLVKEGRAGPDVVVGDSAEELKKMSGKTTATKRAAAAAGALAYYALPFFAKDAKPVTSAELLPVFAGITAKTVKDKRQDVIKKIGDILKPRFAKDQATPDDVILRLVDMIDGGGSAGAESDEGLDASVSEAQHNAMEAAAHGHSTLGIPKDVGEEYVDKDKEKKPGSDDGIADKVCAFLASKGVAPEVLAELKQMLGAEPPAAADENVKVNNEAPPVDKMAGDEPPPFKGMPKPGGTMAGDEEKDMVTKTAMDSAIQAAVKAERENAAAVYQARAAVRPYVGEITIALDSADAVFGKALQMLGVKIDGVHPSAYRTILEMQPKPGTKPVVDKTKDYAMDSAGAAEFAKRNPGAARIRII